MTDTLDLFAVLDAPPPARPPAVAQPVPEPAVRQPAPSICQPMPAMCQPAEAAPWRYIHPEGTPIGLIARACLCGRRDERPGPALDHVRCDPCGQPDGLRARPWRPTGEDLARPHRR